MARGGTRLGTGNSQAVSPVIGIVLLVAIVVLLAGTVSYVALGVDTGRDPTPTFSKVEDYNRNTAVNGQYLNVTHGSGENVDTRNMTIRVEGATFRDTGTQVSVRLKSSVDLQNHVGDEWVATEELSIDATMFETASGTGVSAYDHLSLRDASVKVVWVPQNEGYSDVIYRWEGPTA